MYSWNFMAMCSIYWLLTRSNYTFSVQCIHQVWRLPFWRQWPQSTDFTPPSSPCFYTFCSALDGTSRQVRKKKYQQEGATEPTRTLPNLGFFKKESIGICLKGIWVKFNYSTHKTPNTCPADLSVPLGLSVIYQYKGTCSCKKTMRFRTGWCEGWCLGSPCLTGSAVFCVSGTFAVVSLMTGSVVERMIPRPVDLNSTSPEAAEIEAQKIGVAAAVAFLSGIIMVCANTIFWAP